VTVKCVYVKISDMHRISLSSVLLFFENKTTQTNKKERMRPAYYIPKN
jgi:hypothetical protein